MNAKKAFETAVAFQLQQDRERGDDVISARIIRAMTRETDAGLEANCIDTDVANCIDTDVANCIDTDVANCINGGGA